MIGLKRNTVKLEMHQPEWDVKAAETIAMLKEILGPVAVDIQHIGSTSIQTIHAKPILDLVIGVNDLEDIKACIPALAEKQVIFRGQDHPEQLLFAMGDFEQDTRTHHIHVTVYGSTPWQNYVNFRDYLNAFPEKAKEYDDLKLSSQQQFANDRGAYTASKNALIDRFNHEAKKWADNK